MPAVGTEDLARYIIEPSKRGAPRGPGRDGSPPPIPKEIGFCLLRLNRVGGEFLSFNALLGKN